MIVKPNGKPVDEPKPPYVTEMCCPCCGADLPVLPEGGEGVCKCGEHLRSTGGPFYERVSPLEVRP